MLRLKGDVLAFYEIAATLIPVLLFGGVVSQRLIPPAGGWRPIHHRLAWLVPGGGCLAVVAEIVAISVLVTGTPDLLSRYLVSGTLVLGMLAVVGLVWWPWLEGVDRRTPNSLCLLGISVAALFAAATYALASAVDVATTKQESAALRKAFHKSTDELEAARARVSHDEEEYESLDRQRESAEARHEPHQVIATITRQEMLFTRLSVFDTKTESRLFLRNVNLYRRLAGLPSIAEEKEEEAIGSHPGA
jgi:hypothetical protein